MDNHAPVVEYWGDYKILLKRRIESDVTDLVVLLTRPNPVLGGHTQHKVYFDGPDLVVAPMEDGVDIDFREDSMLSFSGGLEGSVRDMFLAIAAIFGRDGDAGRAYEKGRLEGENAVLWKWATSGTGLSLTSPTSTRSGGVSRAAAQQQLSSGII